MITWACHRVTSAVAVASDRLRAFRMAGSCGNGCRLTVGIGRSDVRTCRAGTWFGVV